MGIVINYGKGLHIITATKASNILPTQEFRSVKIRKTNVNRVLQILAINPNKKFVYDRGPHPYHILKSLS